MQIDVKYSELQMKKSFNTILPFYLTINKLLGRTAFIFHSSLC